MKRFKGLMLTMLAGTLMLAVPAFAAPRGGGGHGGGHGGEGFSRGGGGHGFSGGGEHRFSGGGFEGRRFEGHGFEGRGEHHDFDRDRGHFRGDFGLGFYPGYVYPYDYSYVDPYYYEPYYNPYYAAPPYYGTPAAPACNPNGYYDANGNFIPGQNCQVPPAAPAPYGY